jgi:hypothetical protein
MNGQQQEILQDLRNAAKQDEWNLCRDALKKLLPDLNASDSLKIITRLARRFLADVFKSYPEDEKLGTSIETLNNITSLNRLNQQGILIDSILKKYWDSPGVSNFRNAFKGISKPEQYFEHSGDDVDVLVSLISRIVTAIVINNYWYENPEFSATFFGSDTRKAVFMVAYHDSDPKQIALRESLWTSVADELEIALKSFDASESL